jgi:dienelactone hydrolase
MLKRFMIFSIALLSMVAMGRAKIVTKDIDYTAGDTQLSGYLAYDDSITDKAPAVIVVHEWWGNDDYPKMRARQLAELGYVAFAADMYGKGKTTDDPKQAGEWAGQVKKDASLQSARFNAALKVVQDQPNVDTSKIAAIGYCFGGTIVLNAARANDALVGVVSFHGDLSTDHPATDPIKPKILVCTGAADAFVPKAQVDAFKDEMTKAGADSKVIEYPGAHHAFTNPQADSHHMDNIAYNAEADKASWEAMKEFFKQVLGK